MKGRNLLAVIVTLIVALVGALPVLAAADMDAALDYLGTQQNADGGFGSGFSPDSSVSSTADAVHAIVATQRHLPPAARRRSNTWRTMPQASTMQATYPR